MTAPMTVVRQLGCADTYTAHLWQWDREHQQMRYYAPLTGIISVEWERVLNNASQAIVKFAPVDGDDCCGKLAPIIAADGSVIQPGVWPWAHELALYRDTDLVWQGPVTQVDEFVTPDETTDYIQITAKDFLAWLDVRVVHQDWLYTTPQAVTSLAETLIQDGFGPDDPHVLAFLDVRPGGESQVYSIRHWEAIVGDELHNLGGIGLDYTSVGRAIIIRSPDRDTTQPVLMLRTQDFLSGVSISIVGSLAATGAAAVGSQLATPPAGTDPNNVPPVKVYFPAGGPTTAVDPFFGLEEQMALQTNYNDTGVLTTVAENLVLNGKPPPTTITIPDNSSLTATAPVSIHDLVPSSYFLIAVKGTCRQVSQFMRLSHVHVTWTADQDEQVGVTFVPGNTPVSGAAGPDTAEGVVA